MNHVDTLAAFLVAAHLYTHIFVEMSEEAVGFGTREEAFGIDRAPRSISDESASVLRFGILRPAPFVYNLLPNGCDALSGPHFFDEIEDFGSSGLSGLSGFSGFSGYSGLSGLSGFPGG